MDKKLAIVVPLGIAFCLPAIWYLLGLEPESLRPTGSILTLSLLDQVMVVFTAFVLKPLYMFFSVILAWIIRKSKDTDLRALKWGLLAFFTGEFFCMVNYLVFQDRSHFTDFLHNSGMVIAFGFIAYALLEGLDKRIIQYSNPQKRCALIGLCDSCIKSQAATCQIRNLFLAISLSLGLLTFIPLTAQVNEVSYNANIFDTIYNYTWLQSDQSFEIRYCPLLALTMFLAAFVTTWYSKKQPVTKSALILLSTGVGSLGFAFFRLLIGSVYISNLSRADSWEEITEFLLMIIIAYILWQFRQRFDLSPAL